MSSKLQTASILVVDDESEICEILSEYFSDLGNFASTALNAAEARK